MTLGVKPPSVQMHAPRLEDETFQRSQAHVARAGIVLAAMAFVLNTASPAAERAVLRYDGRQIHVEGRLLNVADDGRHLLQTSDGVLWAVQLDDLLDLKRDTEEFAPLDSAALGEALLDELPAGFEVHRTAHYVICHDTTRAYASWCGALLERLNRAFTNYWSRRGFELHEPDFPLVAIIFARRADYREYAALEVGEAASSTIGYYNLRTNRITTYDLTGSDALRGTGGRSTSARQINALLSRPEAGWLVATVIHEATHQIAFNCGLHTRYADIPLWISEGIAVCFETPDLSTQRGWKAIDNVNPERQRAFRAYRRRRPADSLQTLISSDERFRDASAATDAYAEAWALNYFLMRQRREDYHRYLQMLAEKQPLDELGPQERYAEFVAVFGEDLTALDAEFLRYIDRLD